MLSYKSNHSNSAVRRTSTHSAQLVVIVVIGTRADVRECTIG